MQKQRGWNIMLLVYPIGAPLTLWVMLWKIRGHLNPPEGHERDIVVEREEDPVIAEEPISSFALVFRPKFWYFEVVSMMKRLMLTCMVVICRTLAQTTCFVLFVTIFMLVLEREVRPYVNQFVSAFTYVLSWQNLLFILYLLLLDAEMVSEQNRLAEEMERQLKIKEAKDAPTCAAGRRTQDRRPPHPLLNSRPLLAVRLRCSD